MKRRIEIELNKNVTAYPKFIPARVQVAEPDETDRIIRALFHQHPTFIGAAYLYFPSFLPTFLPSSFLPKLPSSVLILIIARVEASERNFTF